MMKVRKMLSLLLSLCLLISAMPALAAPSRDLQEVDVDIDAGMRSLVELVMGASVLCELPGVEQLSALSALPAAPGQVLSLAEGGSASPIAQAALGLGLYRLVLPHNGQDLINNRPTLTEEEAKGLYRQVFTSGEFSLADPVSIPNLTVENGNLVFDLTPYQDYPVIGAYIYSVIMDDAQTDGSQRVLVDADIFTYFGEYGQDANDLPETALTWIANGRFVLRAAPESVFGYTVDSFSASLPYQDGMLDHWQTIENTEYEYSVNLPAMMGLSSDDPAAMAWQTADGSADVTIQVRENYPLDYAAALAQCLQDYPESPVMEEPDFHTFYTISEGLFRLWVISPDINWAYLVTMHFPPERQAEYSLYAEFIRNSLIIWGISNG